MDRIKIGMIGAAFIAEIHIDAYKRSADLCEVVAVCDKNEELGRKFAKKHEIARIYTDADEMMACDDIEVIDVCVPNFLHSQMTIKAFEAGKNVICEKPLATTLEDGKRMLEAAAKVSKHLYYAEDWLFAPAVVRAREIINQGGIGRPLYIKAKEVHNGSHSPFAKKLKFCGGGSMIHLGVHPIGFLLALKGGVKEIIGMTTGGKEKNFVHHDFEGEDWAVALIKFDDDTTALVEANYITTGGMQSQIEIYGEEGLLNIDLTMSSPIKAYSRPGFDYAVEKADTSRGWTRPAVDERFMLGYIGEIRHFLECIYKNVPAMKGLRGEDGYMTLQVIFDIYRSAREGVSIKY